MSDQGIVGGRRPSITKVCRVGAAFLVVALGTMFSSCKQESANATAAGARDEGVWTLDKRRELAALLAAEKLDAQALRAYRDVLDRGEGLSENVVAGLSRKMADLEIRGSRYEDALVSLFRAKMFTTDSVGRRDVEEKIILCFERLGRSGAADRHLDRATNIDAPSNDDGTEVLAEIGKEKITRADLDAFVATQPPQVRERLEDKETKREILRTLVAKRVLLRKAKKLGLDKDVDVRRMMEVAQREVLVQSLMKDELDKRVQIKDDDVKLYFDAHRERFRIPTQLEIARIVVDDTATEARVRVELASGTSFEELAQKYSVDQTTSVSGGRVEKPVIEGRYHDQFVDVAKVFEAIGETPAGQVANRAVTTAAGPNIVKVLQRTPGRDLPFEEVQDEARRMLTSERQQAVFREMLDQAVQASDVRIHAEKL